MKIPEDLKYTKNHEWVRVEGDVVTEGITDYAQHELSDVVYIDLPKVGSTLTKGEPCGTIETVKAVSDLYAGVSGEVTEINEELNTSPQLANEDPYGKGWMFKVKMGDAGDLSDLLDAPAYESLMKEAG
jgi:glycine cleavage system H protein